MSDAFETIKQSVELIFSAAPYPGDDNIVSHKCLECDVIAARFRGHHWKDSIEHPWDILGRLNSIALLSPEACRFYMPLFLFAAIDRADEAPSFVECLVYGFICPGHPMGLSSLDEKDRELFINPLERTPLNLTESARLELEKQWIYYRERMAAFDPAEIDVIINVLKLLRDRNKYDDPDILAITNRAVNLAINCLTAHHFLLR